MPGVSERNIVKTWLTLWGARLYTMARWLAVLLPLGLLTGSACALFLWALDVATQTRYQHGWLLYLLPLGGLAVGLVYHHWGKSAEGGNNLVLEEIHEPGAGLPKRMAPLILGATVATHVFGGSAGREGTAVQMGGAIASSLARLLRMPREEVKIYLMAGVAAGFGAVFGTPVAGAVFALEVLAIGRMQYHALIPCLVAAIVGDWSCQAWGITHTHYKITFMSGSMVPAHGFHLDLLILGMVAAAGILFGWASALFAELTHTLHAVFKRLCPYAPVRPVIGGVLVIALVFLAGTRDYLGLGVTTPVPGGISIVSLFEAGNIHYWAWAWKILFTAITLSSGFKGGEVTPLFFIGAALGNALSVPLGVPTDLFAALGFVAVFAGASNTPLACTIMGMELFGSTHGVYLATACFMAYLCSGHSGIYLSQRIAVAKTRENGDLPPETSLRQIRHQSSRPLEIAWRWGRRRLKARSPGNPQPPSDIP